MGEKFLFFAAAIVAACAPAHASPWNRKDSGLFLSTTANYYRSDTNVSRYTRIDSDTYLEFGVTSEWMLGGRFSYGTSITDSPAVSSTDSSLSEAEIFAQRQIQRAEHSATSLRLTGARSGNLSIDAQSGAPAPNMEFEIRALHGRDIILKPFKIFAASEVAYRHRLGGDAEQIRADALVGLEPVSPLLILLEAQSITSLRNENAGFADFDLYKGQASVIWRKSRRWSFIIGARKEISARNIAPGTAYFIGAWSEF